MCEEEKSNLYIYTYSDLDDDFIFVETKYTLGDLNKLQKENKILKENAENNDKVVDKVNWENQLLKKENEQLKGSLQTHEILLRANVEENQQLKEQLQQKEDIINKAKEYCNYGIKEYITDDGFVEEVLRDVKKILDNKGEMKDE